MILNFSTEPQHKIDFGPQFESAEQALERKWRKYFGGNFNRNYFFKNCLLI